jgi:hypothetical protein
LVGIMRCPALDVAFNFGRHRFACLLPPQRRPELLARAKPSRLQRRQRRSWRFFCLLLLLLLLLLLTCISLLLLLLLAHSLALALGLHLRLARR